MVRTLQYYSVPGCLGKCRGRLCRKFSVLRKIDILLSSSRLVQVAGLQYQHDTWRP